MIGYQHTKAFLNEPVRTFFCPEIKAGSLSYADPLAYRAQDLCRAASIVTLHDLKEKTVDDLRSASFSNEVIAFIRDRLAQVSLSLQGDVGYRHAFAATSRVPAVVQNMTAADKKGAELYLRHLGITG